MDSIRGNTVLNFGSSFYSIIALDITRIPLEVVTIEDKFIGSNLLFGSRMEVQKLPGPNGTKSAGKSTAIRRADQRPPDFITDTGTGHIYHVLELLGIGGFARVYKIQDMKTKAVFACKIMNKNQFLERDQMEKVCLELVIHKEMNHDNIVKLYTYFQDDLYLYIVLELCSNGTLSQLLQLRGTLTELEARYFVRQILWGLKFLHSRSVVHRDIKTSNILIHEDMTLRIADFGLATLLNFIGQRKTTVCGTPNYIPPEILTKSGHSFEADIWSVGVILYSLLIGTPPFQKKDVDTTVDAIKTLSYQIPHDKMSIEAKNLIESILVLNPFERPTLSQVLCSDFMRKESIPRTLPNTILTSMKIKFTWEDKPVTDVKVNGKAKLSSATAVKETTKKNVDDSPIKKSRVGRVKASRSDPVKKSSRVAARNGPKNP